jgi:hypothetical protein
LRRPETLEPVMAVGLGPERADSIRRPLYGRADRALLYERVPLTAGRTATRPTNRYPTARAAAVL